MYNTCFQHCTACISPTTTLKVYFFYPVNSTASPNVLKYKCCCTVLVFLKVTRMQEACWGVKVGKYAFTKSTIASKPPVGTILQECNWMLTHDRIDINASWHVQKGTSGQTLPTLWTSLVTPFTSNYDGLNVSREMFSRCNCSQKCVLLFQVRLQVQSVDKPLYRGTYHCFQSIIRQESVRE